MRKLIFNKEEKSWSLEKGRKNNHPVTVRNFRPLLDLFRAADFFYWTVDHTGECLQCSHDVTKVLGYSVKEFKAMELADLIYPEDLPAMERFIPAGEEFLDSLSDVVRPFCKVQFTFRIRTKSDLYKKVMLQKTTAIHADSTLVAYMLVMTDLCELNFDPEPSFSLVHFRNGHSLISFQKDNSLCEVPDLSPREWEVLEMVMEICDLSLAAERLEISLYTLRNHLMNIRIKMNATSLVHLLTMAEENKWIKRRDEERGNS